MMTWLAANNCASASGFGWALGAHGGLFIDLLAVAMLLSSLSYRRGVRNAAITRLRIQRLLRFLPWLPVLVWAAFGFETDLALFPCYAPQLALGAAAVLAPAVAVFMLTAANSVGKGGVRS
jgi:hypothetical protein